MTLEDVKLGLAVMLCSFVLLVVSAIRGDLVDILIAIVGLIVGVIVIIGYVITENEKNISKISK